MGVGNDPDPVTEVRGANGRRGNTIPFRIEPARGQVPENLAKCSPGVDAKEPWHVLQQHVAGSQCANDPRKLGPEPSDILGAFPLPSDGRRLTGEPGAQELDALEPFKIQGRNVSMPLHIRPVPSKDALTKRVDLTLPPHGPASAFQPEVPATDTREQGPNRPHQSGTSGSRSGGSFRSDTVAACAARRSSSARIAGSIGGKSERTDTGSPVAA